MPYLCHTDCTTVDNVLCMLSAVRSLCRTIISLFWLFNFTIFSIFYINVFWMYYNVFIFFSFGIRKCENAKMRNSVQCAHGERNDDRWFGSSVVSSTSPCTANSLSLRLTVQCTFIRTHRAIFKLRSMKFRNDIPCCLHDVSLIFIFSFLRLFHFVFIFRWCFFLFFMYCVYTIRSTIC